MVSEEINFNHALEAAGIQVVETDLGEYIVQLRGERPSHILTPAVHLRRGQVGQLFHDKLGTPYTEDIPEMVATARRVLREVFLTADIGVSGVNFGVAETGTLCLVTNEGNGRMVTSLPPVHVALMGIERLVPTLDDLALFLSLLPRSATGQKLSVYTSLIHAPKRPTDVDGPRERHLILVDNGRSALRASPLAEALYCIRCGACLNACPVFREIGGHAYLGRDGSIAPYPGPIGSVVSPGLVGLRELRPIGPGLHPVRSLPGGLPGGYQPARAALTGARRRAEDKPKNEQQDEGIAVPGLLKLGLQGLSAWLPGTRDCSRSASELAVCSAGWYSPRKNYMRIPAWTGWGYCKDFPRLEARPFRARWKSIQQEIDTSRESGSRPQVERRHACHHRSALPGGLNLQ